jgi:hypothetical protein
MFASVVEQAGLPARFASNQLAHLATNERLPSFGGVVNRVQTPRVGLYHLLRLARISLSPVVTRRKRHPWSQQ